MPKNGLVFADSKFKTVPVEEIIIGEENVRAVRSGDADIAELAKTIREHDILQPVICRADPQGYILIAGERRLRAAKKAGRASVPVIIRNVSEADAAEIAAIENLHRKDLEPLEQAAAVGRLLTDGKTLKDVAKSLGKTVAWVAKRANLAKLCAEWQQAHADEHLAFSKWTASHLELVARLPVEVQRTYLASLMKVAADKDQDLALWTVDELAASVARFTRDLSQAPWKLDAPGKPLACDDCTARSDAQPELWEQDIVRCLDKKCFEKKLNRYIKQRVKILRAEHGSQLMLISADAFRSTERIASIHDVERIKKSAKGARAAIIVKGEGAGQEFWAKYKDGCGPQGPPYKYAGELADLVNAQIESLHETAFGKSFGDRAWMAWFISAFKSAPGKTQIKGSQKAKDTAVVQQCQVGFGVKRKHFSNGVEPEERARLSLIGIDVDALKVQIDAQHSEEK